MIYELITLTQINDFFFRAKEITENLTQHFIFASDDLVVTVHAFNFIERFPDRLFEGLSQGRTKNENKITDNAYLFHWLSHPECNTSFGRDMERIYKGSGIILGHNNSGLSSHDVIEVFREFKFNPLYKYRIVGLIL